MYKVDKSFIISAFSLLADLLLDCGRREELKGTVLLEVLQRRAILNYAPSKRGSDECTQPVLEPRESL